MRTLRSIGLLGAGAFAGFAAAGALLRKALPSRGDEESDEVALVAVFDGVALRSRSTAFRGGSVLAWFGGVAVDLREAALAPGAHLTLTSVLGGIAVRVPPGWRVESNVTTIAGGATADVSPPADPDAPLLVVDGISLLGGIALGARVPDDD
jgi:hypothetical protein